MAPTKKAVKKVAKKTVKKTVKKLSPERKEFLRMKKVADQSIANGIAWLDLTFGREEWLRRMDMSNFDFTEVNVCVAGHVFSDAFLNDNRGEDSGFSVVNTFFQDVGADDAVNRLGFDTHDGTPAYQYMQDVWARTIVAMQKKAKITK